MSDKSGGFQIFSGRNKPKIVETASVGYNEKIKIVSVTSEKIRYFFTADSMHFICFRYELDSLLGIK